MTAEESSTDEKMPPNEAESAATNAAAPKMDPETEPLTAGAMADPKVKFTGESETVDVEKGGQSGDDGIKPALTKAELMKYATDPFWVKLRWVLFILFWICWTAMLVASIVIIIQAPKCPSPAPKNWWQKRPFYQISVKSFKDSNSDGNGDLNGVLEKADYLANTVGVGSIGLSPIMKNGDYKNVDESLGTMEDFKKLVAGMHEHEIKVVLELPSENSVEQTNALPDTLRFWLNLGVDGFRVSGMSAGYGVGGPQAYDLEQTLALLEEMRTVLDNEDPGTKILMTDVNSPSDITAFYGANVTDQVGSLSQMPMRDTFLPDALTADNVKNNINEYLDSLPNDAWPSFSLGKNPESRIASKVDEKYINALNMMLMMLPGTPITLFGDERGLKNGALIKWDDTDECCLNKIRVYQEVSSLRESETLLFGSTEVRVDGDVLIIARVKKGNPGYILLSNFGDIEKTVNVKTEVNEIPGIPNMAERGILTLSDPQTEEVAVGASIDMAEIPMPPGASYLITFVPNF